MASCCEITGPGILCGCVTMVDVAVHPTMVAKAMEHSSVGDVILSMRSALRRSGVGSGRILFKAQPDVRWSVICCDNGRLSDRQQRDCGPVVQLAQESRDWPR